MTDSVWHRTLKQFDAAGRRNGATTSPRAAEPAAVSNDPASLPLLTVDVQHLGSRVLLTAAGEVDVGTSGDLQQVLHAACDSGAPEIWLDLTRMRFLECRGLHVLLDLHARLTEERRRLVLICPPGPVLRLLALTRARHEFEIHSTAPPAT